MVFDKVSLVRDGIGSDADPLANGFIGEPFAGGRELYDLSPL